MVDDYASRLRSAMDEARCSIPTLAKHLEVSYQAVKKVLDGQTNSLTAANNAVAAKVLQVSGDWLAVGWDPKYRLDAPQQARPVSHLSPILAVTTVAWEKLKVTDLRGRFQVELPDDALAPECPAGTTVRFDGAMKRTPGRICLVRDRAGDFYARIYEIGPGDAWRAVATARGYPPLNSQEHGLEYVATMYGMDYKS